MATVERLDDVFGACQAISVKKAAEEQSGDEAFDAMAAMAEEGARPGVTEKEAAELKEGRMRIRLLELANQDSAAMERLSSPGNGPKTNPRWFLTSLATGFKSR